MSLRPQDFWLLPWGSEERFHEVSLTHNRQPVTLWLPCSEPLRLLRVLESDHARVSAVPRKERHELTYGAAHMLWAELGKPEAGRRLTEFRPGPTAVWRERNSSHRIAVWSLSKPLPEWQIERANARLSYCLHGVRGSGAPGWMMPSPWSHGWAVEYAEPVSYLASAIVKRLADAPDPKAWRAQRRV